MNVLNLLQGSMGNMLIENVTKRLGVDNQKVRMAIAVGVPLLITALSRNAKKEDGANGIMGAINKKHDGGILDNLSDFFGGKDSEEDEEGVKILGHVLGQDRDRVTDQISKKSGLNPQKVVGILSMLAPVVMGLVGKNAKKNESNELSGLIGGLLGGVQEKGGSAGLSFIENLLDGKDDDDDEQSPIESLMNVLF